MKRRDIFTQEEFNTSRADEMLSPTSKKVILDAMTNDPEFKKGIITAILSDDKFKLQLATTLLSVPAQSVGLNLPGSIADIFRVKV